MIAGHVYVVKTTLTNPPKDKIVICFCDDENLFFWVNTKAAYSGVAQIALSAADHPALTHDCFLDCSRVTTFSPAELAAALDRGGISSQLAQRIIDEMAANPPPKTVPKRFRDIAIQKLLPLI